MRPKSAGPKEITAKVVERMDLPKSFQRAYVPLVEEVFRAVEELVVYNPVRTPIGWFKLKTQKERNGRNPSTGETIVIPERVKLVFKPTKKEFERK